MEHVVLPFRPLNFI